MTTERRLRRIAKRIRTALLLAALFAARPTLAVAHTGDDATFKHVVAEFALWGLGLAAALALLVAVFWVRARILRRDA